MPNSVKYNTSTETLSLKKGNFWIGTGDVDKGPTSTTGFYNGITPPSGGYTIYVNKATGGPSIRVANNDSDLIAITNSIAGASYTTVNQCFNYFAGQSDKMVVQRDYEGIVTDGLVLNLDAGYLPSYPQNGTSWYDLGPSGNTATLINGPTFTNSNGGGIVFDGTDDYGSINVDGFIRNNTAYTFNSFFYYNGGTAGGAPYNIMSNPNNFDAGDGFWQHLNLNGNWLWRTEDNVSGEFGGVVKSPNPFSNGNYYYLTSIVKTNTLLFYINGVLQNTIDTTFQWSRLRTDWASFLYIGTGYGPTLYRLNGTINTFSLYNRELSAAEILQNYNAQKSRFGL